MTVRADTLSRTGHFFHGHLMSAGLEIPGRSPPTTTSTKKKKKKKKENPETSITTADGAFYWQTVVFREILPNHESWLWSSVPTHRLGHCMDHQRSVSVCNATNITDLHFFIAKSLGFVYATTASNFSLATCSCLQSVHGTGNLLVIIITW